MRLTLVAVIKNQIITDQNVLMKIFIAYYKNLLVFHKTQENLLSLVVKKKKAGGSN